MTTDTIAETGPGTLISDLIIHREPFVAAGIRTVSETADLEDKLDAALAAGVAPKSKHRRPRRPAPEPPEMKAGGGPDESKMLREIEAESAESAPEFVDAGKPCRNCGGTVHVAALSGTSGPRCVWCYGLYRLCWNCQNTAWHTYNFAPHVDCRKCGSRDTRRIDFAADSAPADPPARPAQLQTDIVSPDPLEAAASANLEAAREEIAAARKRREAMDRWNRSLEVSEAYEVEFHKTHDDFIAAQNRRVQARARFDAAVEAAAN